MYCLIYIMGMACQLNLFNKARKEEGDFKGGAFERSSKMEQHSGGACTLRASFGGPRILSGTDRLESQPQNTLQRSASKTAVTYFLVLVRHWRRGG